MIMALMATDLPEPVEPAMRTWGMEARSAVTMRPLMSLPMARVRRDLALCEGLRLHDVAQVDGFALVVGNLDADGAFAGHALDEDAFGAHGEAEVVGQAGDARVFDAGFGLELVGGDHGAGVDLDHLAAHVELGAFLHQDAGFFAQLVLADGLRAVAGVEQGAGRQLEAADILGRDGGGAHFGVGAVVDGDLGGRAEGGSRVRCNGERAAERCSGPGAEG